MNRNEINEIEIGTFDSLLDLDLLDLSDNRITKIDSLFLTVKTRLYLYNNYISTFDFHDIGRELKTIDLKRNRIKMIKLVDPKERNEDVSNPLVQNLEFFYVSDNQLNIIDLNSFPKSIKVIDFGNNTISSIEKFDHRRLNSLTKLDLRNNQLTEINFKNILTYAMTNTEISFYFTKLQIYLYENNFVCSCENDWLVDSILWKKPFGIVGIDYCQPIFNRIKKFTQKLNTKTLVQEDMLCKTNQNCPPQCHCYINPNIPLFVVDCFNASWENSLSSESFPMLTNEINSNINATIFFDANTKIEKIIHPLLTRLMGPLLFGRILYMNNSHLTSIEKDMYKSVPNLTELHLEQNYLFSLNGDEFDFTTDLEKLFLHENYLQFLPLNSFRNLLYLKHLTLHNNKLSKPQLWTMAPFLSEITLWGNPLKCDCDFVTPFKEWVVITHALPLEDYNNTLCIENSVPIMNFDTSKCFEPSVITIVVPIVCIFTFLTFVCVLLYLYRMEMKVLLYSKYRLRFFNNNQQADQGKMYDAFISYANEDDQWVANQLVPKLDGYVLCLHQRDFPAGGYIVDSIVHAVENSCRTVIILTPNYVRSMWCRFEFDTAHMQSLQDKCKRLVVVMLEDVDRSELDKNLHAYLKTNTYLHKSDSLFWSKLKYTLPNKRAKQEQNESSL